MTKKLTIVLADDHQLIREGVKIMLNSNQHKYEVIGEAENGIQLLEILTSAQPDVILMDINMPGMDGVEATKKVKALYPNINILALSMSSESDSINAMIEAGGNGYLLKHSSPDELFNAIDEVCLTGHHFSEDIKIIIENEKNSTVEFTEVEKEIMYILPFNSDLDDLAYALDLDAKGIMGNIEILYGKTATTNMRELLSFAKKNEI